MNENTRGGWGLLALGLCLALGLIVATGQMSRTLLTVKSEGRIVEVKGYAERRILSDFALWRGHFTVRHADLATASTLLERQREQVVVFVRERGFSPEAFELSPVQTNVLYGRDAQGRPTNQVEGYALSLEITVHSREIDAIGDLARESSALVQRGIELSSWPPEYFYTELDALKVEMLGEATADARRRAGILATESGGAIGPLRWARQGVFQITPAHSTEITDYGRNDTSSREKSIKAVVTVGFALRG